MVHYDEVGKYKAALYLFIYLFMIKSYKSTQENTKKNKKTNEQRIGLRHTQRFTNKINVHST